MNKTILLTSIIMLSVGLGVGYWLSGSYKAPIVSDAEERKPLFYRNSMNPSVISPVPAKDSMGMDYVPVLFLAGFTIIINVHGGMKQ